MKVTIIKGPMYEKVEKEAHKLICQIVKEKIHSGEYAKRKSKKEDDVSGNKLK